MSDFESNRTTIVTSGRRGGPYLAVGMLVVVVLIGAYILIGAPGLHTQVARGPVGGGAGDQSIDVSVQQQASPAPDQPKQEPLKQEQQGQATPR